jgi:hypothetical protein
MLAKILSACANRERPVGIVLCAGEKEQNGCCREQEQHAEGDRRQPDGAPVAVGRSRRPTPRQHELNGLGLAWLHGILRGRQSWSGPASHPIRLRVQVDIGDHFVDKLYAKLATPPPCHAAKAARFAIFRQEQTEHVRQRARTGGRNPRALFRNIPQNAGKPVTTTVQHDPCRLAPRRAFRLPELSTLVSGQFTLYGSMILRDKLMSRIGANAKCGNDCSITLSATCFRRANLLS